MFQSLQRSHPCEAASQITKHLTTVHVPLSCGTHIPEHLFRALWSSTTSLRVSYVSLSDRHIGHTQRSITTIANWYNTGTREIHRRPLQAVGRTVSEPTARINLYCFTPKYNTAQHTFPNWLYPLQRSRTSNLRIPRLGTKKIPLEIMLGRRFSFLDETAWSLNWRNIAEWVVLINTFQWRCLSDGHLLENHPRLSTNREPLWPSSAQKSQEEFPPLQETTTTDSKEPLSAERRNILQKECYILGKYMQHDKDRFLAVYGPW